VFEPEEIREVHDKRKTKRLHEEVGNMNRTMWISIGKMAPLTIVVVFFIGCLIFVPGLHPVAEIIGGVLAIAVGIAVFVTLCIIAKDGFDDLMAERRKRKFEERYERERREVERIRLQREMNQRFNNDLPEDAFRVE